MESLPPLFIVLAIFGILAAFFRQLLGKVIAILVVEIILVMLFPDLLVYFARLVTIVRDAIK